MKLNATRTQCSQNAVRTQQKRRTQGRTPSTLQNAERIVLVHLSCCCARVICWAIPKSLHVAEPRRSGATDLVAGPSARSTTQTNSNKSINNSSSPSPNACPRSSSVPPCRPPPYAPLPRQSRFYAILSIYAQLSFLQRRPPQQSTHVFSSSLT